MKPLYYVYVRVEEQAGDADYDLAAFLVVYEEPDVMDVTFETVWNDAKEACREEGLWDWPEIVDKLREWGFVIHDHSDVPLFHVEA